MLAHERPSPGSVAPAQLLRAVAVLVLGGVLIGALAHGLLEIDLLVHSHWLPGCIFRAATGLPCPGCGMSRALLLLAELRIGDSLAMHPGALPLLLAMLGGLASPRVAGDWLRAAPLRSGALALLVGWWLLNLSSAT